jgi:hypothetical protein
MSVSATCAEGRTNDGGDDAELLTILSAVPMIRAAAPLLSVLPFAVTEGDAAEDRAAEIDWGGIGGGGPHLEPGRRISVSHCSPHESLSGGRGMV